ncbi:MAG: DUF3631 domain-containing protein [Actinobacteria bacterium]|nr:DUF3631 domain-containing protein [Actinomycetota bacterium]
MNAESAPKGAPDDLGEGPHQDNPPTDTPTSTCASCGGELFELLDGTDACPTCGIRPNEGRILAELLEALERFVCRFVRFQNEHQSAAVALWVVHVYVIAAAIAAAYLRITSAAEESGKTTLIEVLEVLLGRQGINAVSVTPAAVFRIREKRGPVALLLDEIDNTLKDRKDDSARDLLAIVHAGYRRSARVLRTVGQNHEPREFPAFGPCAIAGLGTLHPTTESRCIPIVLVRKPRGDGERWLPHLVQEETRDLVTRLEAWAAVAVGRLSDARPNIPADLRDRHAEAWWGLFAIADVAAGDWPTRARQAALVLHASRDQADTYSIGVLLLAHIRQAFEDAGVDRLSTVDLLHRLVDIEAGPWGRFWGSEIAHESAPRKAASDLARHLRAFGIKPRVIRVGAETPRGYMLDDFTDAFALYLAPTPGGDATPETNATPLASDVAAVAFVAGGLDGGRACPDCGAHSLDGHAPNCPGYWRDRERADA